jgi:hypothetical protein
MIGRTKLGFNSRIQFASNESKLVPSVVEKIIGYQQRYKG